jgi:hypothetical protein
MASKFKIAQFGTISEHPDHPGVLTFKGFTVESDKVLDEQEMARALINEVVHLLKIELSNIDKAIVKNTHYVLYRGTTQ